MTEIAIATEDVLTEVVCERIANELGLKVFMRLRRGGCGYLKSRIGSFIEMARQYPVLVVTDLDDKVCAEELVRQWVAGRQVSDKFFLRVAVREVESWIMADRDGFGEFIGARIDFDPEQLPDPKAKLLHLALQAPRAIREELISQRSAIASQGVGYNTKLSEFVAEHWCPRRASVASDSLRRTVERLSSLLS